MCLVDLNIKRHKKTKIIIILLLIIVQFSLDEVYAIETLLTPCRQIIIVITSYSPPTITFASELRENIIIVSRE